MELANPPILQRYAFPDTTPLPKKENKKLSLGYSFIVCIGTSQVAYWLLQHNLSVTLAACDTFRSGAVEQLRTHARRLQVAI
jgi:hypothetical protein